MNIKILGTGCKRCKTLELNVRYITEKNNIDADIVKVTEINEMIKYGIRSTPGLVINEKLKSSGIIPKDEQVLTWLLEET